MNLPALNRRKKPSILVVEDEAIVRADIEDYLKNFGYRIAASVGSGEEAKAQATKLRPDLVLMDIMLSGKVDGIQAGKYIQQKLGIPVVFVTAHGDEPTLQRAKLNAPFGYVLKPFNERELRSTIEIAIFRFTAEDELRRLYEWLRAILNSMSEAVIVTDRFGFIKLLNARATDLTGWQGQKACGKAFGQVLKFKDPGTGQPVVPSLNEGLLKSPLETTDSHLLLISAKGAETPVRLSFTPMVGSDDEVNGLIIKLQPFEPMDSSAEEEARPTAKMTTRAARSAPPW